MDNLKPCPFCGQVNATVQKSINEHSSNAGRKPKLTFWMHQNILMYHRQGSSVRQIVHLIRVHLGQTVSVGFVQNAIHQPLAEPLPAQPITGQLTLEEMESTA